MRIPFFQSSRSGFSLIEITIAMAIAAVALVSLLGMLPQALRMSRDSADQTAIGVLLEDAHDRLEGQPLTAGTPAISPLFYDQQGRLVDVDIGKEGEDPLTGGRFFRVELTLREIHGAVKPDHAGALKALRIEVYWPLQPDGTPLVNRKPGLTVSYPVTALTGPDWEQIDPDHVARIEF